MKQSSNILKIIFISFCLFIVFGIFVGFSDWNQEVKEEGTPTQRAETLESDIESFKEKLEREAYEAVTPENFTGGDVGKAL